VSQRDSGASLKCQTDAKSVTSRERPDSQDCYCTPKAHDTTQRAKSLMSLRLLLPAAADRALEPRHSILKPPLGILPTQQIECTVEFARHQRLTDSGRQYGDEPYQPYGLEDDSTQSADFTAWEARVLPTDLTLAGDMLSERSRI